MDNLTPRITPGAQVKADGSSGWRLTIPGRSKGKYHLAQLDDYIDLPRLEFPWKPPLSICLSPRMTGSSFHGTWGFGLWNDPFAMSLGFQGRLSRLPTFPNTAWFFFASPENHLTLRNDLPPNGMLAAVFSSLNKSRFLRFLAGLTSPLVFTPITSSLPRRLLGKIIREDSIQIQRDWSIWHQFHLQWDKDHVAFELDGQNCHQSTISPQGRLGFVIWIDNQFAHFAPKERLKFGTLDTNEDATLEIKELNFS